VISTVVNSENNIFFLFYSLITHESQLQAGPAGQDTRTEQGINGRRGGVSAQHILDFGFRVCETGKKDAIHIRKMSERGSRSS